MKYISIQTTSTSKQPDYAAKQEIANQLVSMIRSAKPKDKLLVLINRLQKSQVVFDTIQFVDGRLLFYCENENVGEQPFEIKIESLSNISHDIEFLHNSTGQNGKDIRVFETKTLVQIAAWFEESIRIFFVDYLEPLEQDAPEV